MTDRIGTIQATTLTWNNAASLVFDVDFAAGNADQITLSGDFLKSSESAAGAKYLLEFVADALVPLDEKAEFQLIAWSAAESVVDFTDDDFDFSYSSLGRALGGIADYTKLEVRADGLYLVVSAIPEPAVCAAIFGAFALALAAFRRR